MPWRHLWTTLYLDVIGRDEEGCPADDDEEPARQEVGDDVVGHLSLHVQLKSNIIRVFNETRFISNDFLNLSLTYSWTPPPLSVDFWACHIQ